MNQYVQRMKNIVTNYYKKAITIQNKLANNSRIYSDVFIEEANKEVLSDARNAHESALCAVRDIFLDLRSKLASVSFLNAEALTADRVFFSDDSGFTLSTDDIRSFCDRYQKNHTMMRLIRDYCQRNDLADVQFVTEEEQLDVYKKFAVSAQDMINRIYDNPAISELTVNAFADPQFLPTAELLAKIGDGSDLDNLPRNVPETVAHRFDGVTLTS